MWTPLRSTVMAILAWLTSAKRSRAEIAQTNKLTRTPPKHSHPKRGTRTPSGIAGNAQPAQPHSDDDESTPLSDGQSIRCTSKTLTPHSTQSKPNEPISIHVQPVPGPENLPRGDTAAPPKLPDKPRPTPSARTQLEPDPGHTLPNDQNPPTFASSETHRTPDDTKPQHPDAPAPNSAQPKNPETETSADTQSTPNNTPPPRNSSQPQSEEGHISPTRARQTPGAVAESNESSAKPEHLGFSPPEKKLGPVNTNVVHR